MKTAGVLPTSAGIFSACFSRAPPLRAEAKMNESSARPATPEKKAEIYGPFSDGAVRSDFGESTGSAPGRSGAAEIVANPDRVVLVFGPGLTYGYAYIGVLRALAELKVGVQAIYATEVGALGAALYFTQPNANRVDWALLRFNEKNLKKPEGKLAFVSMRSPEVELADKLHEVFGERKVATYAPQLHIMLEDTKSGQALEAKSGELWRAIRATLSGVNGFSAMEIDGRPVRGAARKVSETYRMARQNEHHPVIVVTAGSAPNDLLRKLIEGESGTLLSIPLPGIGDLDLQKRNQAVFSGKNAVHQAANEILGLVGRKVD